MSNFKIIVTNFFCKIYFISVKGQSLEVTPNPVIGVLGESAHMTWTYTKKDGNADIISARFFLGNSTEGKLLFDGPSGLNKKNITREIFGERIQTSFKKTNYTLTLKNLSFTDTFTFTLVIVEETGITLQRTLKSVTIREVRGMYFL